MQANNNKRSGTAKVRDTLECHVNDETYVVFPADITKGDGVDVLIEDEGEGDDEAEDSEALGTEGIRENLEGVRYDQRSEGNIVGSIEQEDESDDRVSGGVTLGDGITSRANGLEDEEKQHASAGGNEEDPSSDTFDECGGGNGPRQIPNLEDTVDEELDCWVGNSDCLEHLVEVVGDEAVPRPLGEPSNSNNNRQTLAVAGGVDH